MWSYTLITKYLERFDAKLANYGTFGVVPRTSSSHSQNKCWNCKWSIGPKSRRANEGHDWKKNGTWPYRRSVYLRIRWWWSFTVCSVCILSLIRPYWTFHPHVTDSPLRSNIIFEVLCPFILYLLVPNQTMQVNLVSTLRISTTWSALYMT